MIRETLYGGGGLCSQLDAWNKENERKGERSAKRI